MSDSFYSRFENRFRGTREAVKKRFAVYSPLLAALKQFLPPPTLLDLGCGRGEWLELAQEAGWNAFGVDLDEGMLGHAGRLGLHVRQAELLEHLREQADASLCLVTAFHVAEHLSFPDLLALLQQSYRVLRPGGLMILETPNPENLAVAGNTFYLDPSHRNPLPPELLSFLAEDCGFCRNAVIRLHAPPDFSPAAISMQGLFYGVSPDYALVAQKKAFDPSLVDFAWPPSVEQGCSLFEATAAYDYSLHRYFDGIRKQQEDQVAKLQEAMELQAWQQMEQIVQVESQQREFINAFSARLDGLILCQQELQGVYASRSWRITVPLRSFSSLLRWGKDRIVRAVCCLAVSSSGHEQQSPEHSQVLPAIAPEAEVVTPVASEGVSSSPVALIIEDEESEAVPSGGSPHGEIPLEMQRNIFVSREICLYEKMKAASTRMER